MQELPHLLLYYVLALVHAGPVIFSRPKMDPTDLNKLFLKWFRCQVLTAVVFVEMMLSLRLSRMRFGKQQLTLLNLLAAAFCCKFDVQLA